MGETGKDTDIELILKPHLVFPVIKDNEWSKLRNKFITEVAWAILEHSDVPRVGSKRKSISEADKVVRKN